MRKPSVVKVAGATGLAIGMAVGGYGFASAASGGGSTPSAPASAPAVRPGLAAAANALHMTVADLQAELAQGKSIAAVAKEKNVDVNTVIDAMVADAQAGLRKRIEAEVNGTFPAGRPGPGFPGGRGPFMGGDLKVAAGVIGITPADLQTAVRSGQTIAQVAQAHGKTAQAVIDALVKDRSAKIDQAVADGKITKAQGDQLKAAMPQQAANEVNGVHPMAPGGPWHRPFGPKEPSGSGAPGASPAQPTA